MPEEMGLILNLIPRLNPAGLNAVKRQIDSQLGGTGGAKTSEKRTTEGMGRGLGAILRGDLTGAMKGIFGGGGKAPGGGGVPGLKGLLGVGGAAGLGAAGGMAIFTGIKSILTKIFDLFQRSSPLLQRSLKMIQMAIMSTIRPFADTLARIMMPISRFFLLWGRAIYAEYRKKYKEYVAAGMSPIEASIKASTEAFIDGIVGLFTGAVGGIDLGTSITEIIGSIVAAFAKAVTDPAVMVDLLLIGGLVVGAITIALAGAAVTFLVAMQGIAWLISGAAALGLTTAAPAFAGVSALIAGAIGAAALLGLAALGIGIMVAIEYAMDWLSNWLKDQLGLKPMVAPEGGPPLSPEGQRLIDLWNLPNPLFHQRGGIFTKPTFGLIGEAGPEAVIPLSKMGGLGGVTNVSITITGNTFTKEIDLERTVKNAMDDYIREFERGR